jgi:CD109 antigen
MLAQTMDGLESLLQMPFGCGEQNMVLFAPNVFVTKYLRETGQLKPEIMAKAETLMLTGYQRELTYWRADGSFSAFGDSDPEGSLWLSAFVLKCFAQSQGIIYVDEGVLNTTAEWIRAQRKSDGSYAPVGFVHHEELFGGLSGNIALTAFVAIALHEAGDSEGAGAAVAYLEGQLDNVDDDYGVALLAYALGLTGSARAGDALSELMDRAKESPEGIHWGDELMPLEPGMADGDEEPGVLPGKPGPFTSPPSAAIETTGYAALALLTAGDRLNAASAVRWLTSRRNAFGGFGSTQDTVVALQAITTAAALARDDIDATVFLMTGDWSRDAQIDAENADILQIFQIPAGGELTIETSGNGQVMGQVVRRYNLPDAAEADLSVFDLRVDYSSGNVAVDDTIDITARIRFTPPEPMLAGMIVLDVAIPTGFAPVEETIDALIAESSKLKRWELAGRKVIFYIEDMEPEEELTLAFEARALYPVRAQPVASQVYAYYKPSWRGESLGGRLVVA